MSNADAKKAEDFVSLGQSGIPVEDIRRQVETLCHSAALENQTNAKKLLRYLVNQAMNGKVPSADDIGRDVLGKRYFGFDDSQVRVETGKLRKRLDRHYASPEVQPEEIRFDIPRHQYGVFVLRPLRRPAAIILEPANNAEVYQRVTVRGRIDTLNPDLRAWLVVKVASGNFYPQCRVSRKSPEWEHEVRIGTAPWGSCEGLEFEIQLVAADTDGDFDFYENLKSGRDGFGFLLPSDVAVLDSRRVIRRDIRPNQQAPIQREGRPPSRSR